MAEQKITAELILSPNASEHSSDSAHSVTLAGDKTRYSWNDSIPWDGKTDVVVWFNVRTTYMELKKYSRTHPTLVHASTAYTGQPLGKDDVLRVSLTDVT